MTCEKEDLRLLLSDFVLELLPVAEEGQVVAHLAICEECRATVQGEREVGQQVRQTIAAAPVPPPARLRALMPAWPRRPRRQALLWRPAAALALLVFLFLGSLQMNPAGGAYLRPTASATVLAATATQVPTSAPDSEAVEQTPALSDDAARRAPVPIAAVNLVTTPAPPRRAR